MIARSTSLRSRLLLGASAGALMLTGSAANAGAGASNPFARIADPAAQAAAAAAAKATQGNTAIQASQRALAAFAHAAALRQNMDTAQAAARAATAAAEAHVPDGLGSGGLQVAPGVAGDPSLWLGAKAPTQSTGADGRTKVDIDQTQQQAILNWQTFNVGQKTDVNFNQGGSNWAVLNRITDPSANPTSILGTIHAPGTVLIMNANGVIFGHASQINVGNLVAAAGKMTDSQFLNNGIYSALNGNSYTPVITDALGKVQVNAGAQITTNDPATVLSSGGYVMLLGGSVENDGAISTPEGQTLLAAGDSFAIRQGLGTTANQYSTTRGNEVAPTIAADSPNGTVTNAGEITATQGDITLAGRTLTQDGILLSTSTVTQRGTIHLLNSAKDAQGSITFTGNSYTAILPELDSTTTALDSQRDQLIADSATQNTARTVNGNGQFDDLSILADREDQSRIEINTGGTVEFQNGSLSQAQGGQIAASAGNRIQVDTGATLDVSGVQNVALDVASNDILINVQGNELRDSPVNRDNPDKTLYSGADDGVWVDARDLIFVPAGTGGDTSDRYYTPGGLLEVSGYVGNTGHTIGEWDASGGTITLSAKEVVAQKDALFDVAGGSLAYAGGDITDTLLQGADGNMYTANTAPANVEIVSIGKSTQVLHTRWGAQYTETYQNPFTRTTTTRHEDSYIVGKDGGQLILSTPTVLFDGTIEAETIQGQFQTNAHPQGVTDGYKVGQTQAALNGGLVIGHYNSNGAIGGYGTDVQFGDGSLDNDAATQLDVGDAIDPSRTNTAWLDAGQLSSFGLGTISVVTSDDIAVNSALTLADGGALSLTGAAVDINANVTARSGSINIGNIFTTGAANGNATTVFADPDGTAHATVADNVTLDLRGTWTNELTDPTTAPDLAYANGGNVTLDSSQDVSVGDGAVIDVSSGGGVLLNGKTEGGRGGNVTLVAGDANGSDTSNPAATLTLDGVIHAEGVSGGGTLTISAPGTVLIGNDATLSGGQLTLAPGTPAHVNLTLAAPVTIPAGDPLPLAVHGTSTQFPLDTPTTLAITPADPRVGGVSHLVARADWTIPAGITVIDGNGNFLFPGAVIKAGTTILAFQGTVTAGAIIPSAVFPNGLAAQPYPFVSLPGTKLSTPTTYAAGTVIPAGTIFDQSVSILPVTTFDSAVFQSGFSNYVVNGGSGVLIAAGTTVNPEMPIYQFNPDSQSVRSGADPETAMSSWLPPLFLENPQTATLTQRGGASITLQSSILNGTSGGALMVADGSSITVDPGQNITLDAFGQITVDGDLIAHGGAINIINEATGVTEPSRNFDTSGNIRGNSIWIDNDALLDVSGEAYTATDIEGHTYGTVTNGGSVHIGGTLKLDPITRVADTTTAFVVIRPGAEIDADGAQITIDPAAGTNAPSDASLILASNGGSVAFDSSSGLYLDGNFHAKAGGPGTAGGSFSILLDSPAFSTFVAAVQPTNLPAGVLTVTQSASPSLLPTDLSPGDPTGLTLGQASVSADTIEAGGFDTVALNSRDFLLFAGDVSLKAGLSLTLNAGAIVSALPAIDSGPFMTDPNNPQPTPTGHVKLSAPYILFRSPNVESNDNTANANIGSPSPIVLDTDATFEADADLIDIQGQTVFSAFAFLTGSNAGFVAERAPGFDSVTLKSQGDIRFVASTSSMVRFSAILTAGDLTLIGAQLYPTTGAMGEIEAGDTLTIGRINGADPALPSSVFGSLLLTGQTIIQGGIVRAPLGQITIGGFTDTNLPGNEVDLLPDSITSVSGAGLIIPYGGTADGVTYNYDGTPIVPRSDSTAGISIEASVTHVDKGALLDLSGGGTLTGAAFIPGRGGSVDVLTTPLANANPTTPLSNADDKVYAIVPGYGSNYAPVVQQNGAGDPVLGQQVTIPAGVPGLPAGTYTLLPANYALLPGAYRVELGKTVSPLARGVNAIGNGTYAAVGYASIANTGEKSALPSTLLITSGTGVRSLSQYDEESYADYLVANAGTFANASNFTTPPLLPDDAKTLSLSLDFPNDPTQTSDEALTFAGTTNFQGADGGSSSGVIINAGTLEIYGDAPTDAFSGTSLSSALIAAIGAPSLTINAGDISVRPGVTISAAAITLGGTSIDIGAGATLTTIGQGDAPARSLFPISFANTTLALSNGILDIVGSTGTGAITIEAGASLFAGGTLAFATNGQSSIDNNAHFGASDIALAVNTINVGSADAIAAAGNPAGLLFDQALFNFLISGDPTHGAPALKTFTLSASNSVNFFGTTGLDASGSGIDLMLTTPAIYGYGAAGDTATLAANKITWNGIVNAKPPTILPNGSGTGLGTLDIKADEIDFSQFTQLDTKSTSRSTYGFGTVNIEASNQIVSAGNVTLSTFTAPSTASGAVLGQNGTGGNLNLITPLLTGVQGSVMTYTAGGAVTVTAPTGVAPSTASSTVAGAEIDLNGDSVVIDSTILLPSGKLAVNADGDISLGGASRIDLSGQPTQIQKATVYGFGGDAIFDSMSGSFNQDAGSVIDVSATQADAGAITVAVQQGAADFGGTLKGAADAGFTSGDFSVAANSFSDFAALNAMLNQGGVFDARSFDLRTGDLVIGDGVKARAVTVSVDAGALTITGTIDASGDAPGTIRLAGKNGLTLASSAVLDTHGTKLQVDSYGQPIEANNRGEVELAAPDGMLTLTSGATIDVSAPDGVARGLIELDAERTSETGGDIAIDASGPLTIRGAISIAVNGFWTYSPTDQYGTIVQDNGDGAAGSVVNGDGWLGMDQVDQRSVQFIDAALANDGLQGRLAGLKAYGAAYHLRPGVEIDSATPNGTLTVAGDIDLSGFRYGPHADRDPNSATYGAGEPGDLVIRAGGDLDIVGSISDGFRHAPATPDDNFWVLQNGSTLTGNIETLLPVTLNPGTSFPTTGGALRYAIPINPASIAANAVIPTQVALSGDVTVPAGTRLAAPVYAADGTTVLYQAGTVFASATTLPAGSQLGAGSALPTSYGITAMTWPAGANLNVFTFAVSLSTTTVVPFEGVIPGGATVQLSQDMVPTRPTGSTGTQGSILAIAAMLPQGDLSSNVRLVAGADLEAADTRIVRPASLLEKLGVSGNLTLMDPHISATPGTSKQIKRYFFYYYYYGNRYKGYTSSGSNPVCTTGLNTSCGVSYITQTTPPKFLSAEASVLRTGTGSLDLIAGGSFNEQSLYGVYTAGTQSAPILDPDGSNPFNQPRGLQSDGTILLAQNAPKAQATEESYQAWYPEHGGDVLLSAQGDVSGHVALQDNSTINLDSDLTGNWLWRQGGGGLGTAPTAWWINFGTYAVASSVTPDAELVGFQGVGTMGGGNLTVIAGHNAGNVTSVDTAKELDLAIGSTGRVLSDGTLVETGGGDLVLKVGNMINGVVPTFTGNQDMFGSITDLRGDVSISAGTYGRLAPSTVNTGGIDPRPPEAGVVLIANAYGGPTVTLGDGRLDIHARGDLVLGGAGDAGVEIPIDTAGKPATIINPDGTTTFAAGGSNTTFTLWTPTTAINLFSAGGDVDSLVGQDSNTNNNAMFGFYPGTLIVAAANGNIRFGGGPALELAPSPVGQLELLAANSIYGSGQVVAMSGADMASLATPFHPAFAGVVGDNNFTNTSPSSAYNGGLFKTGPENPIAFGPDTPTSDLHAGDSQLALIYAGTDIDSLTLGQIQKQEQDREFLPSPTTWYIAAKPFDIIAGRDILGGGQAAADVFQNLNPADITSIHAGRDIYFLSATIAGPGLLDIQAGRNITQAFRGTLESVGPLFGVDPTNPSTGASIVLTAAVGSNGPDYGDFGSLYLNPANAADPNLPLSSQPGKALQTADTFASLNDLFGWLKSQQNYKGNTSGALAFFNALPASERTRYPSDPNLFAWLKSQEGYTGDQGGALAYFLGLTQARQQQFTYDAVLTVWLQQRFGYGGTQAGAYAYFAALPTEQQAVFDRTVYYAELTKGGREFNDPSSERSQSYLRGRDAIAALFPTKDAQGNPITYTGEITMFSGLSNGVTADSGIRTDFGGDIQILNPGGQTLLGTEGVIPGPNAGLLTQGVGNIDIYSEGSILLGESRILTTFGGGIVGWSSTGDINSGRGSKTTVIFTPPRRIYDEYGEVTLSPSVPSSGAGIGTLAPITDVPPGDIDLIAPLGTIDAGEAGIRVSGNVNLAALHIINAANIQVKGNATGIPVVAAVNTGALTSASSAAAAVSSVADQLAERARPQIVPQMIPSIITGRVIGFGDE